MKTMVERWKTSGGRYFYELYESAGGFSYRSNNGGGNLGPITRQEALSVIEAKILMERVIDKRKYTRKGTQE